MESQEGTGPCLSTEITTMGFGQALEYLKGSMKSGERAVTIRGWYGSVAQPVVKLQVPDTYSKMTEPYLYMEKWADSSRDLKKIFPLDLSCESILSDQWVIVNVD